jgi:hypothetical protein
VPQKIGKCSGKFFLKKLKVEVQNLMNKILDIRQVEFVLAVDKHNPILLNPEFLKSRDVIPVDWELAQPPTYTNGTALVAFQNGIYLAHQGTIIAFFEDTRAKSLENLKVPEIVCKYIKSFPQEHYRAIGLNLEGHTTFDTQDQARDYLFETLLNSEHLHESDQSLVQAVSNFIYKLDRGVLTLTVRNTGLQISETENIPVILFAANFHRDIAEIPEEERLQALPQIINNWPIDIATYQDIVNNKFLGQNIKQPIWLQTHLRQAKGLS